MVSDDDVVACVFRGGQRRRSQGRQWKSERESARRERLGGWVGSANRETVSEGWPVCLAVASGDVASAGNRRERVRGGRDWVGGWGAQTERQ